MPISRRNILKSIALRVPALQLNPAALASGNKISGELSPMEEGPFQSTRASLRTYKIPEWFRDAKFGIWAHWGPQSSVEFGDWYVRNMYMQGNKHTIIM